MKVINKSECHYYQFTCNGREGPQIRVTEGSIRYKVKEGPADQPGHVFVSNATIVASTVPVLISTGIHTDTRLYTLFITGSSVRSQYEVSPVNASIASIYKKDQQGWPKQNIGDCKHQEW